MQRKIGDQNASPLRDAPRRVRAYCTVISTLIVSFMYEQRSFQSGVHVNKANFRLNPLNGTRPCPYLPTGCSTCVRRRSRFIIFLRNSQIPCRRLISLSRERVTLRTSGKLAQQPHLRCSKAFRTLFHCSPNLDRKVAFEFSEQLEASFRDVAAASGIEDLYDRT